MKDTLPESHKSGRTFRTMQGSHLTTQLGWNKIHYGCKLRGNSDIGLHMLCRSLPLAALRLPCNSRDQNPHQSSSRVPTENPPSALHLLFPVKPQTTRSVTIFLVHDQLKSIPAVSHLQVSAQRDKPRLHLRSRLPAYPSPHLVSEDIFFCNLQALLSSWQFPHRVDKIRSSEG